MNEPRKEHRSSRQWWLLLVLISLLAVCLLQRERLAQLPNALARRRIANRHIEAAMWWLQFSKRVSRTNAEAEFLLGRVCRKQGTMDEARRHLRRAKYLGYRLEMLNREEWLAAAQAGQMNTAEPHLTQLLQNPQGDMAEICEAYSIGFLTSRRFSAALDLLDAWRQDQPKNPQPLFWTGQIHRDLEAPVKAEEFLRKALALDSSHAAAALGVGEILLEAKKPAEAVEFFQIAVNGAQQADDASLGLARCWRAMGKAELAVEALDGLLQRQPTHIEALVERANVAIELGEYAAAEERLRPAIELGARDRTLRFAYGTALRGMGRSAEAQSHFEYATLAAQKIALANDLAARVFDRLDDTQLRYEVGQLHLEYGSSKEGIIWLQSVLEYDPGHQLTHAALAAYYEAKLSTDQKYGALAQQHRNLAGGNLPPPGGL